MPGVAAQRPLRAASPEGEQPGVETAKQDSEPLRPSSQRCQASRLERARSRRFGGPVPSAVIAGDRKSFQNYLTSVCNMYYTRKSCYLFWWAIRYSAGEFQSSVISPVLIFFCHSEASHKPCLQVWGVALSARYNSSLLP